MKFPEPFTHKNAIDSQEYACTHKCQHCLFPYMMIVALVNWSKPEQAPH